MASAHVLTDRTFVNNKSADGIGTDSVYSSIQSIARRREFICQQQLSSESTIPVVSSCRCITSVQLPVERCSRCLRKLDCNNNCNDKVELPTSYILNPTSLAKNNAVQLLATNVASYKADIIIVTETWFKVQHDHSFINIDGYTCFHYDRHKPRGGGVCVYERSNINATRINFAQSVENAEYLWIYFVIGVIPVLLLSSSTTTLQSFCTYRHVVFAY